MDKWKTMPSVLQRKILFTLLAGIGSILVSAVVYIISADHILLGLSSMIFAGCLFRSKALWDVVSHDGYQNVIGTCVGVTAPTLRKYRRIKLMDIDGKETTLLLNKQVKVRIGTQYRFYFQKDAQPVLGNEFLDASLSTDSFLGYENIGGMETETIEK